MFLLRFSPCVCVCVRELEELIFQCGMYVEELKEQVEETPPPSLSAPAEGAEPAQRPEVPTELPV